MNQEKKYIIFIKISYLNRKSIIKKLVLTNEEFDLISGIINYLYNISGIKNGYLRRKDIWRYCFEYAYENNKLNDNFEYMDKLIHNFLFELTRYSVPINEIEFVKIFNYGRYDNVFNYDKHINKLSKVELLNCNYIYSPPSILTNLSILRFYFIKTQNMNISNISTNIKQITKS